MAIGFIGSDQVIGEFFHWGDVFFLERRCNRYDRFDILDILAAFEDGFHRLGSAWCPGSVLDHGNRAVLEVLVGKNGQHAFHRREYAGIIGAGDQHDFFAAVALGNGFVTYPDGLRP